MLETGSAVVAKAPPGEAVLSSGRFGTSPESVSSPSTVSSGTAPPASCAADSAAHRDEPVISIDAGEYSTVHAMAAGLVADNHYRAFAAGLEDTLDRIDRHVSGAA